MSKTVFKVWCEWDIGLNNVLFETADLAWEYAEKGVTEFEDWQDCLDNCLVGVDELEVISE